MPARNTVIRSLLLLPAVLAPVGARAGFTDVTSAWGFFGGQPTWGVQIIDVDADGDLDVFNAHHFYSGYLFANDGTGQLSVWTLPQLLTSTADRHGYVWADLDQDAIVDVVCSHGSDGGCSSCSDDGHELWRGNGGGTFTAIAGAGGMYDQPGRGRAFSAADVDLDGDLDVYHAKAPNPSSLNSLYRNDGGLTFVDVAPAWGLAEEIGTVGGLFADVDDDGDPDLLVGGEEFDRPTTLFRNEGGSFVDVSSAAFAQPLPIVAGADFGDYDDDGDLDLALAPGSEAVYDFWKVAGNVFTFFANHRYGDNGVDVFELDTPGGNPTASFRFRGTVFNDVIFLGPSGQHPTGSSVTLTDAFVGAPSFAPGVDVGLYCWRDSPGGRWIIHVSAPPGYFGNFNGTINAAAGVASPSDALLERLELDPVPPQVLRNDGGVFTDVTAALGVGAYANPRGVAWVDFDSDGDLDLHVVNRGTVDTGNPPDALLRNDGSALVALPGGGGVAGLAQGLADGAQWGDLDRDGDPDVIVQEGSGPLFFTLGCPGLLYRNDGPAPRYLAIALAPPPGSATAVGSRVDIWAQGERSHRRLSANSWRGFQPPLELLVGLGSAAAAESVVDTWPNGASEKFGPFAADQRVILVPGQSPTGTPPASTSAMMFATWLAPQPARGVQRLHLRGDPARPVRVSVFDVSGRLIRELGTYLPPGAGSVEVTWDGRNGEGLLVPAGIYFVRGTGGLEFLRKSVRLR